jgi:hypothetical protein
MLLAAASPAGGVLSLVNARVIAKTAIPPTTMPTAKITLPRMRFPAMTQ